MSEKPKKDYEVGYGKPPAATQFKKGQSGNPTGRKKGIPNFATEAREVFEREVEVTLGGKTRRMSLRRLMLEAQAQKAGKGDTPAFRAIMQVLQQIEASNENNADEDAEVQLTSDQESLIEYLRELERKKVR